MEDPPLNPSQQVERIREILVGRQMHQVEDRLESLERAVSKEGSHEPPELVQRVRQSQLVVLEELQDLRHRIHREADRRQAQLDDLRKQFEDTARNRSREDHELKDSLRGHLEHISSAMASRIDASVREVLQHLQNDLVQWKTQFEKELQSLREETVTRPELKDRFARLASAAMEDEPQSDDGFLL